MSDQEDPVDQSTRAEFNRRTRTFSGSPEELWRLIGVERRQKVVEWLDATDAEGLGMGDRRLIDIGRLLVAMGPCPEVL